MDLDGIKSVPFSIKAAGPDDGLGEGQFEGYCSVFGNVDSYGDIVVKGAFTDSLAAWREKGDPIPLLWGHDFADPWSNIGALDSAEEDDRGLKVRGTFDLENPKAVQVYRLAKGRRTTGMSFAYETQDSEQKSDANYLKRLHIFEASIVPLGANPLAGVDSVKSGAAALVKAGRVLSAKNESSLREARDAIDSVLSALAADEDGKSAPSGGNDQAQKASGHTDATASAASQEPLGATEAAKAQEPRVNPSARALAELSLLAL